MLGGENHVTPATPMRAVYTREAAAQEGPWQTDGQGMSVSTQR